MPHANLKTIYVTAAVHEVIRQAALQRQMAGEDVSMGDIVASLLDPRTQDQRVADEFAAQVRDTQESDRP